MVQTREILMLKKISNLARTEQEVAYKYGRRSSVSVTNKQKTQYSKATDLSTSGHFCTFLSIKNTYRRDRLHAIHYF